MLSSARKVWRRLPWAVAVTKEQAPSGNPVTQDTRNPLTRFRGDFNGVAGFLMPETEVVWDYLLSVQNQMNVVGDLFEIGVYKGRSAYLASLYLKDGETIILVDINDMTDVASQIGAMRRKYVTYVGNSSCINLNTLREWRGTVRWFHIDGDHSGFSTANDLALAASFLGDKGIISVDDFMNWQYPQLCGEVFRFLFGNPTFKMVLSGCNKCYIVRSKDYALYESLIRKYLAGHLRGWDAQVVVAKTSYAHDLGCWTVTPRRSFASGAGVGDRLVFGRDEDPDDIPF